MDDYESLSHSKWECKYHVVFIPKCRRRTLYVELRRHLGEVFRRLAEQKESRIEEGHLLEPIQEVVESDESVVILCWAFDSRGGAPDVEAGTSHCCGPQRSSLSE